MLAVPTSLGLAAMVASVGHSGGQLVYRHGAAGAYAELRDSGTSTEGAEWGGGKEDGDAEETDDDD